MNVLFQSRTPTTISIEVQGQLEVYELLCILDFNNVRKRMSVCYLLLYFFLSIVCHLTVGNKVITLINYQKILIIYSFMF